MDRRSGVDLEGTFSWVFFEGKRGGGCFRQTWRGLLRIKVAGFAWSVHVAGFALDKSSGDGLEGTCSRVFL